MGILDVLGVGVPSGGGGYGLIDDGFSLLNITVWRAKLCCDKCGYNGKGSGGLSM